MTVNPYQLPKRRTHDYCDHSSYQQAQTRCNVEFEIDVRTLEARYEALEQAVSALWRQQAQVKEQFRKLTGQKIDDGMNF